MIYKLNRDSIIFLDSDKDKGYKTIAFDWKNDKIFEVLPPLYYILRALDLRGFATKEDLEEWISFFPEDCSYLEKAMDDLVERRVVIKKA
ncbi:MAG: hypothetical protein N2558_03465 [Patescibacteria group bacterium]|nr:hypothetical protein [Patescibacteria group bacterium]